MKKHLIYFSLLYVCSFASFSSIAQEFVLETKNNEQVICKRMIEANEEAEKVFLRSFNEAYKDISNETLGINDKDQFLKQVFEEEINDINQGKKVYFYLATINNKIVGMISFSNTQNPNEVYIRQLAIAPEYKKSGIGKKLVFLILDKLPETTKMVVATRRVNNEGNAFYNAIGFIPTNEVAHGLNPERYVGFEYIVNK